MTTRDADEEEPTGYPTQAPAPVVATMPGYSRQKTIRLAAEAGSPWSRYAPGEDHTR